MHTGRRFTPTEFLKWTRREIYWMLILAAVPTIAYSMGFTFIALPWQPVAILGTSVAFIVGFKNNASYSRMWEARQIYVPFAMLRELDRLGDGTFLAGYTIWFNIFFSAMVTWAFHTLDTVGESSVNPFEGSANDAPITQISRMIEIDMKDMLNDALPEPVLPRNNILL